MQRIPSLVLGAALVAGAFATLSAPAFADDNPIDEAVEATKDAAGDVVDGAQDAADTVTDSATWDRIAGNWKQLKGSAQKQWGELTDDDLDQVDGDKDILVGKVQDAYGVSRMEAEQQVDGWAADNE